MQSCNSRCWGASSLGSYANGTKKDITNECCEVKPNQLFTRFDPVNCVLLKPRVY